MFKFPYEGYRTRIDIVAVAGTILRRQRRRIPRILDMGHLPPQDIRVADVGLYVKPDLILDVDLVVDFDVDCKDSGHFSPQDILGGRWSKPRGAISLECGRTMSTGGCCPKNIVHSRAPTRQIKSVKTESKLILCRN